MKKPDDVGQMLREWLEISTRRSIHNFVLYCHENGLSMSQFSVLFHIRSKGGCGVSDIAREFGISSAAASQLVERLVQQDLLARSEDQLDRRVKRIELTAKALETIRESNTARRKWIEELAGNLNPEERELSRAGIRVLIDHTKQLDEQSCSGNEEK